MRASNCLQASGDIDPVTEQVSALHHHVSNVHADYLFVPPNGGDEVPLAAKRSCS
jgi:hypothetical protein